MTAFQVFSFLSVAALVSQPTELSARVVLEMHGNVSEWCYRRHPSASQTDRYTRPVQCSIFFNK